MPSEIHDSKESQTIVDNLCPDTSNLVKVHYFEGKEHEAKSMMKQSGLRECNYSRNEPCAPCFLARAVSLKSHQPLLCLIVFPLLYEQSLPCKAHCTFATYREVMTRSCAPAHVEHIKYDAVHNNALMLISLPTAFANTAYRFSGSIEEA